ncbi:MAG: copper amine oxidase N-terminal domain-containing protein [Fermentimonas sp.]|nr:copper amine oxidase N-terminal domain-containing protein [Fermentimonas sp.]
MFKRKWLYIVITVSCAIAMLVGSAYAAQGILIYINGQFTGLNAQMINNSVYVPIRAVSEALGADVSWIQEQQTVKVDSDIKMIASLPEEKTYIYALNEKDGRYDGLILSINGNRCHGWQRAAPQIQMYQYLLYDSQIFNNGYNSHMTTTFWAK